MGIVRDIVPPVILSEFLGLKPQSWELGLEAGIWASMLGFGPQGWNLGLKAGIWASNLGGGTEGWMEKEKLLHM